MPEIELQLLIRYALLAALPLAGILIGLFVQRILLGRKSALPEKSTVLKLFLRPLFGLLPFACLLIGIYGGLDLYEGGTGTEFIIVDFAILNKILVIVFYIRLLVSVFQFLNGLSKVVENNIDEILEKLSIRKNPQILYLYGFLFIVFTGLLGILPDILLVLIVLGLLLSAFALKTPILNYAAGIYQTQVLGLKIGSIIENEEIRGTIQSFGTWDTLIQNPEGEFRTPNARLYFGHFRILTEEKNESELQDVEISPVPPI